MPVFAYRARTAAGRAEHGLVDADSVRSAWQQLRARGVFPTALDPSAPCAACPGRPCSRHASSRPVAAGVPIAVRSRASPRTPRPRARPRAHPCARGSARRLARGRARRVPARVPAALREPCASARRSGARAVLDRLARARAAPSTAPGSAPRSCTRGDGRHDASYRVPARVGRAAGTALLADTAQTPPLATRALVLGAAARATWWLWAVAGALSVLAQPWYATPAAAARSMPGPLRAPVAGSLRRDSRSPHRASSPMLGTASARPGARLAARTAGNARRRHARARPRRRAARGTLAPALAGQVSSARGSAAWRDGRADGCARRAEHAATRRTRVDGASPPPRRSSSRCSSCSWAAPCSSWCSRSSCRS